MDFSLSSPLTHVRPLHWVLELSWLLERAQIVYSVISCFNIGVLSRFTWVKVQISQDCWEQACSDLFRHLSLEIFKHFGLKSSSLCSCYRFQKNVDVGLLFTPFCMPSCCKCCWNVMSNFIFLTFQWATVTFHLPHHVLKVVTSAIVNELKKLNQNVAALSVASSVMDRLSYLLPSGRPELGVGPGRAVDR